jgi:hypothetical protein
MTLKARERLREALTLGPEKRADVAAELLASLDEADTDADADVAWVAEIERRARRVLAGESEGIPWNEARRRADDDLQGL